MEKEYTITQILLTKNRIHRDVISKQNYTLCPACSKPFRDQLFLWEDLKYADVIEIMSFSLFSQIENVTNMIALIDNSYIQGVQFEKALF